MLAWGTWFVWVRRLVLAVGTWFVWIVVAREGVSHHWLRSMAESWFVTRRMNVRIPTLLLDIGSMGPIHLLSFGVLGGRKRPVIVSGGLGVWVHLLSEQARSVLAHVRWV